MNIFYLHEDPKQCAEWMVDRHVVKMILETAQLLSTAHRVLDGHLTEQQVSINGVHKKVKLWKLDNSWRDDTLYKATHINHPSAIWARKSLANYRWLYQHLEALLDEYTYRYGKTHKCQSLCDALKFPPLNIPIDSFTQPTVAMDPSFIISDDAVLNYQNYYKHGKKHLFHWTKRQQPDWL